MAKEEHVLAVDIGATGIRLCELVYGAKGEFSIAHAASREYEEELSEETRTGVIAGLIRQMLAEGHFQGKKALVCVSGQLALMRFSRIPAGSYTRSSLRKIAEYETISNIPFSQEEIIHDYQLLPGEADNIDLISVVIKNDLVESFVKAVEEVGCTPVLIDIATAAGINAAQAVGIGREQSEIVVDLGGRVTNLLVLEGDKVFARTIPIGGYAITQQIAKTFSISHSEAEELKRAYSSVDMSGEPIRPEDPPEINVPKVIRSVLIRLAGEINRTIGAYKAQQGGAAPVQIHLGGGGAVCQNTMDFLSSKLHLPVVPFQPLGEIPLLDGVNAEDFMERQSLFSDCIGLGLRKGGGCSIELSLLPASIRRQQLLDQKKPLLIASLLVLIILTFVSWQGKIHQLQSYTESNNKIEEQIYKPNKELMDEMDKSVRATREAKEKLGGSVQMLQDAGFWPSVLNELYRLKPDNLWLVSIEPIMNEIKEIQEEGKENKQATEPGPEEAGMFQNPGMMDPMAEGPAPESATGMKKVVGLVLKGCCVAPDKAGIHTEIGREFQFPFAVQKDDLKEATVDDGKGGKRPMTRNEKIQDAMQKAYKTREDNYVAALRNSLIFDSNEKMTGLVKRAMSNTTRNFTRFEIQVKFNMDKQIFIYDGKFFRNAESSSGSMR